MATKLVQGIVGGAVTALVVVSTIAAQTDPWDWHHIVMNARGGWFLSGKVELEVTPEDGGTLLTSSTTARLFGAPVARSRTLSMLDPKTGWARDYQSFSPKRGRHYVFNETGYRVKKLSPQSGYDAPVEDWEVTSDEEFSYPTAAGKPLPVYDPYGLLLNLKRLALNRPGDEVELYVATSHGPQRYKIRVGEARARQRTLRDDDTRRKQTFDTEELLLQFEPEDSDADDKGLMGMSGTIEIWVEARTKTLIHVSGKIPDVPGRVVLKLSALS